MGGRVSRALLAFALGLVSAATADACGDKLVGLGGGVPFARIHPQHYVGRIVVYARPDSELRYLDDRHGAARPVGARPPGGRWRVKWGQKVRRFT